MRKSLLIAILLLACQLCFGQMNSTRKIKCRVFNHQTEKAIRQEKLLVRFSNDTIPKAVLTNNDGEIELSVLSLAKTMLIYSPSLMMTSDTIEIDPTVSVYKITLKPSTIMLKEVAVKVEPERVNFSTKTYKIGDLPTFGTPLASSFIQEIPEITSVEGNFFAYGDQNITIYLNGKKVNREAVLKLPLSIIKKMELISDPSLLRAFNTDGVLLNVVTKLTDQGIIGTTSSVSGSLLNTMAGIAVNPYYLKDDLLVTLSFNTYFSNSKSEYDSRWTTNVPTSLDSISQFGLGRGKAKPLFLSAFIQKDISKKLTFSSNIDVQGSYIQSIRNAHNIFAYDDVDDQRQREQIDNTQKGNEFGINSEFVYTLPKSKIFLNLSANSALKNHLILDSLYRNESYIRTDINKNRYRTNDFAGQLSFEHRTSQKFSESVSLLYSRRLVTSQSDNESGNDDFLSRSAASSKNQQNNWGISGNINFSSAFVNATIGSNVSLTNNLDNGSTYSKGAWYSPHIYLDKKTKKAGGFNLGIARTISIPNQVQLNVNGTQNSNLDFSFGNNRLISESSYSGDLRHNIVLFPKKLKVYLNTSLNYTATRNLIGSNGYNFNSSRMQFFTDQRNIGSFNTFYLYSGLSKSVKRYGSFKLSGSLRYFDYDLKDTVQIQKYALGINSYWAFNVSKRLSTRVDFDYKNLQVSPYSISRMRPSLSFSGTGELVKDKLYLELYWTNAFNIGGLQRTAYNSYYVSRNLNRTSYGQTISFSLNYIFGKTLEKQNSTQRNIQKQEVKADNSVNKF
jgi:hypothetical protein